MSVSLVKRAGAHRSERFVEVSPVVFVTRLGDVMRMTAGRRELLGSRTRWIRTEA